MNVGLFVWRADINCVVALHCVQEENKEKTEEEIQQERELRRYVRQLSKRVIEGPDTSRVYVTGIELLRLGEIKSFFGFLGPVAGVLRCSHYYRIAFVNPQDAKIAMKLDGTAPFGQPVLSITRTIPPRPVKPLLPTTVTPVNTTAAAIAAAVGLNAATGSTVATVGAASPTTPISPALQALRDAGLTVAGAPPPPPPTATSAIQAAVAAAAAAQAQAQASTSTTSTTTTPTNASAAVTTTTTTTEASTVSSAPTSPTGTGIPGLSTVLASGLQSVGLGVGVGMPGFTPPSVLQSQEEVARTVYVGNVSRSVTQQQLVEFMAVCGQVRMSFIPLCVCGCVCVLLLVDVVVASFLSVCRVDHRETFQIAGGLGIVWRS